MSRGIWAIAIGVGLGAVLSELVFRPAVDAIRKAMKTS